MDYARGKKISVTAAWPGLAAAALYAVLAFPVGAAGQAPAPGHGAQTDLEKIVSLLKSDLFLEAAELADEALARGGNDAKTEAVCGLALLKAGRVEAAEAVLKRANARGFGLPDAALGLGRIARIRNDSAAAVPLLRCGIRSAWFYEEAGRQLWRTVMERGRLGEMKEAYGLIASRFEREGKPTPDWVVNGLGQLHEMSGSNLYLMEKAPDHVAVPLISREGTRIRMVSMRLNGRGEYPIDIDSASADFLTISPLLAEELGLQPGGSSQAVGVGTGHAAVRFSRLDRVEMGGIVFRDVPVMVSDLHVFRGLRKGLLGTALLKRFNVTIDVRAGVMDLYALDRPELMTARIDRDAVAGEVPLYLFDATMVEASLAGAPEGLCILDSAAATNLVDARFFRAHIKPRLDPARIVAAGIQGAQGAQHVDQVNGLEVRLGPLAFDDQQVNEFSMAALNSITGRYAVGLLGNPILWPYRVHLDFKNGRLILERYKQ